MTRGGTGGADALAVLADRSGRVWLRTATEADVPAVIDLIAADQLGESRDGVREAADLAAYTAAFRSIDADPAHLLVVAEQDGQIVGTFQLSFLPGLARRGAMRAQIEAVRVAESKRGAGLGGAMMRWAIDEATRRGSALVQLTSDKARPDAHRFYASLGFVASHEG
jgi:GNAT superfamily N-acetyltransferase